MQANWQASIVELIRRTSTVLPRDVVAALQRARRREQPGTSARWALDTILHNVDLARQRSAPLCQDTGALLFYCRVPACYDVLALTNHIRRATRQATRLGYLRQNTLDGLTGKTCLGNVGWGAPVIHYKASRRRAVEIRLIMKGGGSENVSLQYSLPDMRLNAGRDLDGVRRCALDAVWRAQGNGCAPGVLALGIGGDRASGAELAKEQLLRPLHSPAADRQLARWERRILREANQIGIGPMGFGGSTTLLGVKIGVASRLPACYFVSVSYMCWALRRRGVLLGLDGLARRWLYP